MSKIIAAFAILGAHDIVKQAEGMVAEVLAARGAEHPVGFPNTAYSLPVIYSLLGRRVDRVADMA